ncbi:unnamed protein product [Litomosoides sigmodontis]|uniref:Uncharacterized protein n=1 Tax=Litomosoides sigmodontis TaxID=42156 RepID=A0A3P6T5X6_LITSI|nr:unnamed protein product [Litomosoides sigmodontis]
MVLNGRLTSLKCCVAIVYLLELFRHVTVDCSNIEAALPLANEVQDQGQYCTWNSYDQSVLHFKERDVPIALVFTVDHNLTPIKLKQVLDTYHAVACLLPNDSNYLYAAVLHLPKNPKLYFGKLLNTDKLHQSLEDFGQAAKDDTKNQNDPCSLIRQTITVISSWLTKAFFFEKVVKHIIFISDHVDRCIISKYLHEIYRKDNKSHRWLVDKIILNATKLTHSHYRLERRSNIAEQLKDSKNRSVFDGTRLLLPNLSDQSEKNELMGKTVIKKSLTEFLREVIFESIVADALFSMELTDNWMKYDFRDFRKNSQPAVAFEGWTWLLNLLRVIFFLVGAFVIVITTCALCGFTCILSSVVRDDYYRRRQMREREVELRILEERLREAEIHNARLNPFNDPLEFERGRNIASNTAVEQLSATSEVDHTQSSATVSDKDGILCASSSWPGEQTATESDGMKSIVAMGRSQTDQSSVIDL